jgi:spore coat protein U-like protein
MRRIVFTATLVVLTATPTLAVTTTPVTHGQKTTAIAVGATAVSNVSCAFGFPAFDFHIGINYIRNPGNIVTQNTPLGVWCTKGATTQISMNYGLYGSKAGSQFGNRSMKSPNDGTYLGYDLCHDAACHAVWTPQAFTYVSTSDVPQFLPVWTVIKTGQKQVNQVDYNDSVTVTVSF